MTMQKSPTIVSNVQIIMSSLKQFERKLDKLQDDVDIHGKTLKELRSLVSGLSAGTLGNPDVKPEDHIKRTPTKSKINTAQQYDEFATTKDLTTKVTRKRPIQTLPSKFQDKWSMKNQGSVQKPMRCSPCRVARNVSSPTSITANTSHKLFKSSRPSKAEAPRKATTLRTQRATDKKRSVIST